MAAALPSWPHAAAVTDTRVSTCGEDIMSVHRKLRDQPCFMRLQGNLILSHGSRRAVATRELDHRVKVEHVADFTDIEACTKLIHGLLAEAPATSEYDLAADNWVGSIWTPRSMATVIDRYLRDEFDDDPVPGLELRIQLPEIRVTLTYSEPKALLLACKEAAAADTKASARDGGELCPICLLDVETQEEESLRLPCSHPFHDRCILPWFHRTSTCPTCRRDIMECFSSVRASPVEPPEIDVPDSFGDQSELDIAQAEQFIVSQWQLFDDESEDEGILHDMAEGDQSIIFQVRSLFAD
ncbi:hypothetical protein ACQ4PT_059294 [Festuca glaucescens]